jgi:hypothetical protein
MIVSLRSVINFNKSNSSHCSALGEVLAKLFPERVDYGRLKGATGHSLINSRNNHLCICSAPAELFSKLNYLAGWRVESYVLNTSTITLFPGASTCEPAPLSEQLFCYDCNITPKTDINYLRNTQMFPMGMQTTPNFRATNLMQRCPRLGAGFVNTYQVHQQNTQIFLRGGVNWTLVKIFPQSVFRLEISFTTLKCLTHIALTWMWICST